MMVYHHGLGCEIEKYSSTIDLTFGVVVHARIRVYLPIS